MTLPIQVGPATVTINRDDRVLVCQPDARIDPRAQEGFFARDTRFVSGWDLFINGRRPVLLNASPIQFYSARFAFTNDALLDAHGPLDRSSLAIQLDRTIAGGVHEDYDITNFARREVNLTIEIEIDSDFADLFDVHADRLVRRGRIDSRWFRTRRDAAHDLRQPRVPARARAGDRQGRRPRPVRQRAAHLRRPHRAARDMAHLRPLAAADRLVAPPVHAAVLGRDRRGRRRGPLKRLPTVALATSNISVGRAWDQAIQDMEALRLEDPTFERGVFIPAAGVPWFVTLFGRDSLIVSMQCISGYPEFAAGALRRLSQLQATEDDPERDMEPGKIPHEIRHGELAQLGILPFQPYYGTHDATSLFVIVLSYLRHWLGSDEIVERYLPQAEAAMRWIDRFGDRDRDGFQEYETRSTHGYYNQGWKDAGDAIQHADGTLAPLPIGTVELQGYVYDAKLRMAAMYEELGRRDDAARLRREARRLFELVNDRLWWDAEGTYYLGLDGRKQPIKSVASNAGHLLSSGIVPVERAGSVVRRLLADDMWSGWGIRTLSSEHVGYNPFSYHTGSIWPHDNAIIAGGFARYGYREEAARVARGIFDATERFQANRVPELFSGLTRTDGSFPVQYLGANVPQAWAAGSIIRFIAIMAGIHGRSDRDGRKIYVDPALPDWLPSLTISNLRAGRGAMTIRLQDATVEVEANTTNFEVVAGPPPRDLPSRADKRGKKRKPASDATAGGRTRARTGPRRRRAG